jgi:tubulin-specific chaperone E
MALDSFYIGKRLSYDGHRCTVRYIGHVKGTEGDWLGIEWDEPSRGKHSGEARSVKYFECLFPNAGSFVRPSRPADRLRTFMQAVRYKYAGSERELNELPKQIRISGKEVEEVGFDKIKQKQAILGQLKRVFLDGLCISHRDEGNVRKNLKEIGDTCGSIVDLDLSNNLFETFSEIALICAQLPHLNSLRLDGNRLYGCRLPVSLEDGQRIFSGVWDLTLESAFLDWKSVLTLCSYFPELTDLSLLRNNLSTFQPLPNKALPHSITTINLGFNQFQIIGPELSLVSSLPNLKKLLLHQCGIKSIASPNPQFSKTLAEVDLSYNEIDSWQFIDQLPDVFPGLTHLIISHNPLFEQFPIPQDASTADLLVTARLGNIIRLNNSAISPKYRQEAEMYYIAVVARELELHTEKTESEILSSNPRYSVLCSIHDTPIAHRSTQKRNPNALEARLMKVTFTIIHGFTNRPISSIDEEIPRELSIYGLMGQAGRLLDIPPVNALFYFETKELQDKQNSLDLDSYWDSEEETEQETVKHGVRLNKLVPSTRTLGTTFDGDEIHLFIKERD